jgi:hypothetical protein
MPGTARWRHAASAGRLLRHWWQDFMLWLVRLENPDCGRPLPRPPHRRLAG